MPSLMDYLDEGYGEQGDTSGPSVSPSSDAERSRLYDILSAAAPDTPAPDTFRETPVAAKARTLLSFLGDALNAGEGYRRSNAKYPLREGTPDLPPVGAYSARLQEQRAGQSRIDYENRSRTAIASDRSKRTAAGLRLGELDKKDARAENQRNKTEETKAARRFRKETAADALGVEYDDTVNDDELGHRMAQKVLQKRAEDEAQENRRIAQADKRISDSETRQNDRTDKVEARTIERERRTAQRQAKLASESEASKLRAVGSNGALTLATDAKGATRETTIADLLSEMRDHAVALGLDEKDTEEAVQYFRQILARQYVQALHRADAAKPPQRGEYTEGRFAPVPRSYYAPANPRPPY